MAPLTELLDGKILKEGAVVLPHNKLTFNSLFDEKVFEINMKDLVSILAHQFKAAESRK